jgi:hypothetical protein
MWPPHGGEVHFHGYCKTKLVQPIDLTAGEDFGARKTKLSAYNSI